MALSGELRALLQLTHTGATDLTSPTETVIDTANQWNWTMTDGTGANQADQVWHDQRTLGTGANEDLDLAGGLTDTYGNTLTMARVKFLYIVAATGNGSTITVGAAAANAWETWVAAAGDAVKIRPGGVFMFGAAEATAYAVTAGTGDLLRITNDDGAAGATYDIVIVGASA